MCFVLRLVFSQSLLSLDLIEAFLAHWDKQISSADDQVCVTCSQIAWLFTCLPSLRGNFVVVHHILNVSNFTMQ